MVGDSPTVSSSFDGSDLPHPGIRRKSRKVNENNFSFTIITVLETTVIHEINIARRDATKTTSDITQYVQYAITKYFIV